LNGSGGSESSDAVFSFLFHCWRIENDLDISGGRSLFGIKASLCVLTGKLRQVTDLFIKIEDCIRRLLLYIGLKCLNCTNKFNGGRFLCR
jgi:hypothetical protein